MKVIEPNRLWIGNAREARDPQTIFANDIAAVIDLVIEEPPAVLPREVIYCRFPLSDDGHNSSEMLLLAIDMVANFLQNQLRTLVACSAGMSRSPAIVAAAISVREANSLEHVIQRIASNSRFDISPELYRTLKFALTTTSKDV